MSACVMMEERISLPMGSHSAGSGVRWCAIGCGLERDAVRVRKHGRFVWMGKGIGL